MKKYLPLLAVVAGVLLSPGVAIANPPGVEPRFAALSELGGDGKPVSVPVRAGGTAAITVGVAFLANAPASGVTVNVRALSDVDLPRTFGNCVYSVVGSTKQAWCDIEQRIEFGTGYSLAGFEVGAVPGARADQLPGVFFEWHPLGTRPPVKGLPGTPDPVRGTGPALTLAKNSKLVVTAAPSNGMAYVHLDGAAVPPPTPRATPTVPDSTRAPGMPPFTPPPLDDDPALTPPTTAPTSAPTAPPSSPSATPTPSPTAAVTTEPPPPSGTGGGLAQTGSKTALFAGAGAAILIAGLVVALIARRRRPSFIA
ncbi:LPXTG cell wall anchor domain-containing protein [Paractinoplanes lichenicola]|uniref:LPXTG cell wall anchor domain-containing protein n=1 Tax=Paractinoplanes lichenicola TaxID=2802976 RepID=A0ABS1VH51_9ACTN|nr:LPXTG cell wall anchor domain-containing protein [Actinoplanes lichenicola]MBL7254032.1 LPXTG cell wall anchor domain-containing protein [Actinoplanes lichenicola]